MSFLWGDLWFPLCVISLFLAHWYIYIFNLLFTVCVGSPCLWTNRNKLESQEKENHSLDSGLKLARVVSARQVEKQNHNASNSHMWPEKSPRGVGVLQWIMVSNFLCCSHTPTIPAFPTTAEPIADGGLWYMLPGIPQHLLFHATGTWSIYVWGLQALRQGNLNSWKLFASRGWARILHSVISTVHCGGNPIGCQVRILTLNSPEHGITTLVSAKEAKKAFHHGLRGESSRD